MVCSVDFHIHGTFSGATSEKMVFGKISEQARYKGLDFVGTGDILHPKWMEMVENDLEKVDEGTYLHPGYDIRYVLTTEVEDRYKVHHLILLPSMEKAKELRDKFGPHSRDMNIDGRPTLDLDASRIVEHAIDSDCLIGPSHAFTPWTSIYKEFDNLTDCYKDQAKNIDFLELGLSADTSMADRIEELQDLVFLSNSDAHSPWPNKLGREFNRFRLSEPTSSAIFDSIKDRENIELNVGLDPRLGKYHMTACSNCHERVSLEVAESIGWKCENCGSSIKKGVSDLVDELADYDQPQHPGFRSEYLHIAPLSEIISLAKDVSNPKSVKVQNVWNMLVTEFGDEISVLADVPIAEIKKVTDSSIGAMIRYFRDGDLDVVPGGGGEYGKLEKSSKVIKAQKGESQKRLSDFGD